MTYIKTLKKSLFYSALALSTALSLSMAQPAFANTMPEMSPGQIARDVQVQYNPQTGQQEVLAPTFDPFEEDPELAASVNLRSVTDQVSIEGNPIAGGAILDMAFYYSSPSNDRYDVRGFDDAVFVSGEYAPTVLRDNRILECSENVRETVYHYQNYYSPSIHFSFFRPYRHYSGFYGYNHRHRSPWLRRLYWDYYGGDGWVRRRGPRDDDRVRRRRPHDDDGVTRRRRPDRDDDVTRRRRPDRDDDDVRRRRPGDGDEVTRRRRPDRDDDGTTRRRRPDRDGSGVTRPGRAVGDGDGVTRRPRRDDNVTPVRRRRDVVTTSTGQPTPRDLDRRERRVTDPERRRRPRTNDNSRKKKPAVYRRPANPDAVRSERRETRRAARTTREAAPARRVTPRQVPQRPRVQSAPKPKPAPAVVSRRRSSPPAVTRSKPASRPAPRPASKPASRPAPKRNVNKAAAKAYKSKADNGRSRGRRNFHPDYYDGSRQVVSSVDVNCAREERLSIHIPQERLDAARFDGLTVLVLDRYGGEIPVFVPPNYIEGFRHATANRGYNSQVPRYQPAPEQLPQPAYTPSPPAHDPYHGADPRQPRIYGDPGSVPPQTGYPQSGQ